jgi:hypothetical protein
MTRVVPTLTEFVLRALAEPFVSDALTDAEDGEGNFESKFPFFLHLTVKSHTGRRIVFELLKTGSHTSAPIFFKVTKKKNRIFLFFFFLLTNFRPQAICTLRIRAQTPLTIPLLT